MTDFEKNRKEKTSLFDGYAGLSATLLFYLVKG